jgi:monothiol glutaredoxin
MGVLKMFKSKVKELALGPAATPAQSPNDSTGGTTAPPPHRPPPPPEPESPRGDTGPREYIEALVKEHPVVLFMKGTPSSPQCGFSANSAGILAAYDVVPHPVDVLLDPEVRQDIKDFSGWPTIPQIYLGGEFVGGSDILAQIHENGELQKMVDAL